MCTHGEGGRLTHWVHFITEQPAKRTAKPVTTDGKPAEQPLPVDSAAQE